MQNMLKTCCLSFRYGVKRKRSIKLVLSSVRITKEELLPVSQSTIARGQAFSDEAIGSLYTIAAFLIGTFLFFALVRLVLHILLQSKVDALFTFYYYDDVMSYSNWLLIGLVVLLFAQAFRNGAQLQKEQELTI